MFPVRSDLLIPGTAPLVSYIETAAGREAINCGKPNRIMFEAAVDLNPGISPERTIMIGDRRVFSAGSDLTLVLSTWP